MATDAVEAMGGLKFDPERLRRASLPEIRQSVSPEMAALYALSIGLGQDPLDPGALQFVVAADTMPCVPSFPLVVAYPGFWLGEAWTGTDAKRILHRGQRVEWFAPIPWRSELIGRTRVTKLSDRGAGKGSVMHSERSIVDAASGLEVARVSQTHVLRGNDGFGPVIARESEPVVAFDGAPAHVVESNTRPEQALLYRLNGDSNPLHWDPAVARAAGFERPILHGMCTFGVACHAILRATCDYEASRLRAVEMKFSAPVYPGDSLRTEIWNDGRFRVFAIERGLWVATDGRFTLAAGNLD